METLFTPTRQRKFRVNQPVGWPVKKQHYWIKGEQVFDFVLTSVSRKKAKTNIHPPHSGFSWDGILSIHPDTYRIFRVSNSVSRLRKWRTYRQTTTQKEPRPGTQNLLAARVHHCAAMCSISSDITDRYPPVIISAALIITLGVATFSNWINK